jgi:hypothetical protein
MSFPHRLRRTRDLPNERRIFHWPLAGRDRALGSFLGAGPRLPSCYHRLRAVAVTPRGREPVPALLPSIVQGRRGRHCWRRAAVRLNKHLVVGYRPNANVRLRMPAHALGPGLLPPTPAGRGHYSVAPSNYGNSDFPNRLIGRHRLAWCRDERLIAERVKCCGRWRHARRLADKAASVGCGSRAGRGASGLSFRS